MSRSSLAAVDRNLIYELADENPEEAVGRTDHTQTEQIARNQSSKAWLIGVQCDEYCDVPDWT